ncbi:MAG: hypothetical protein U5N55_01465 [Cypionkella sp.]|nr:hypothetical protein [Cypionkella sp.]
MTISTVFGETIRNDYGGNLQQYTIRNATAKLQGRNAVIAGECSSACVTALPRACLRPSARLGFHSPANGSKVDIASARNTLARHMPRPMANWYMSGPAYVTDGAVYLDYQAAIKLGAMPC